jgi:hypothetical protein
MVIWKYCIEYEGETGPFVLLTKELNLEWKIGRLYTKIILQHLNTKE